MIKLSEKPVELSDNLFETVHGRFCNVLFKYEMIELLKRALIKKNLAGYRV